MTVAFISRPDLIGVVGAGDWREGELDGRQRPLRFMAQRASGPPRCGGRAQPLGKPRRKARQTREAAVGSAQAPRRVGSADRARRTGLADAVGAFAPHPPLETLELTDSLPERAGFEPGPSPERAGLSDEREVPQRPRRQFESIVYLRAPKVRIPVPPPGGQSWASLPFGYRQGGPRHQGAAAPSTGVVDRSPQLAGTVEAAGGSLGPGSHRTRLELTRGMGAGIYWVKLSQAGETRTLKCVLMP